MSISEGQVLQRLGSKGANATLTGTTSSEGPIQVTLSDNNGPLKGWNALKAGTAVNGTYSLDLCDIPVGGPYQLEIQAGGAPIHRVRRFFVGDVWVMAGQSNMQGHGNLDAPAKPHPLVHLLTMRRQWRKAAEPLHITGESPDTCHNGGQQLSPAEVDHHRKTTTKGTGVGLFFGREMVELSGGVPQGLIATAHGGTSMAQWDPKKAKYRGKSLYYSMLESVRATGQPIAGILWYQGESDAVGEDVARNYTKNMKALVAASRRDLRQPKLPWFIVQLSRVVDNRNAEKGRLWNSIQEQQRLLPEAIDQFETVVAVDLTLDDPIHIGSAGYPVLAHRLALAADHLVLRNRKQKSAIKVPPLPKRQGQLPLVFDMKVENAVGGLQAPSGLPLGFTFLDTEKVPLHGLYKIELLGDTIRFHRSPTSGQAFYLSYGYGADPSCNIVDSRGHALPVFGPMPLFKSAAFCPHIIKWRRTDRIETDKKLNNLTLNDLKTATYIPEDYSESNVRGMVDEHPRWGNQSGLCYFVTELSVPEAMATTFLIGYDGPFRLWVNDKPFYSDLNGINPCVPDEFEKNITLPKGKVTLRVAMDLNQGRAWGFFLRMILKGVSKAAIEAGSYPKPTVLG